MATQQEQISALHKTIKNLRAQKRDLEQSLESFEDEFAFAHGHHPNSQANLRPHLENLDPQANNKGGRRPVNIMLSDNAIEGAEILARKLGYLRNGKPNKSAAINYVMEAVHWIMEYGGQFTMAEDGKLHLRSEKDDNVL